jgi:hypothetical protein
MWLVRWVADPHTRRKSPRADLGTWAVYFDTNILANP